MNGHIVTGADLLRAARCSRCDRKVKRDPDANGVFRAGVLVGVICSTCQSDDDRTEAELNAAGWDYETVTTDAFGRAVVRPKPVDTGPH